MSAPNVKPNSSPNGIRYILVFISMVLALPNVQIAEEKDFAKQKINSIFFANTSQNESTQSGAFAFLDGSERCHF